MAGRRQGMPATRRAGAEMSDIGVAEIPVDEEKHPLPPPEPPVKNALLDRSDPAHAADAGLAQRHGADRPAPAS